MSRVECVEGEVLPISGPAMGGGGALSATVQSPGPGTLDLYKFSPFFPPLVPFLYHSLDCVDRCRVFYFQSYHVHAAVHQVSSEIQDPAFVQSLVFGYFRCPSSNALPSKS